MPRFSLSEVIPSTGATRYGESAETSFTHLFYDSRKIYDEKGLFLALRTDAADGHDFLVQAYERGIRFFLVRRPPPVLWPGATFLVVDDPFRALQRWAASHRRKLTYPFVGITGSNAKTFVKEWLFTLLGDSHRVYRSPKSFNSQLGVALAVLGADASYDLALIEAGISKPGEMAQLEAMVQPQLGILTNIGEAHAENFTSREQYRREKLKFFKSADRLILPSGDPALCDLARSTLPHCECLLWGEAPTDQFRLLKERRQQGRTTLTLADGGAKPFELNLPFAGSHYAHNYLVSYAAARSLGVGAEAIRLRSAQLTPVDMRLELIRGIHHTLLINDAYNSDLYALKIALDYLKQQNKTRFSVILSDVLESGKPDAKLYREVAEDLLRYELDKVVCVGPRIGAYRSYFEGLNSFFYPSTEALLGALEALHFENEAILIKGARVFNFERVSRALQEKVHETTLEVNLSALAENLRFFRKRLYPRTRIAAMVKASSYGSGSFEVANLLQQQRVDYLAVAYVDEGVVLREQGIRLPIMVLNPGSKSYEACRRHKLEPEVYSQGSLADFLQEMQGCEDVSPIHLELNTGMNRLGFDQADLPALIEALRAAPEIRVASVFSHLAASEQATERAFTLEQIRRYEQMAEKLQGVLKEPFLKHILNSSGILHYPDAQFDMVRLGIGLYGFLPDAAFASQLEGVVTLKSVISQIHLIEKGTTVGYGRHFRAQRRSRIATVPIGYADGLDRRLGRGVGYFSIGGQRARIVGDLCMDMTMVDVTEIDCQRGEEVVILGEDPTVPGLAETLETIPYDILTRLSPRVKRRYFHE